MRNLTSKIGWHTSFPRTHYPPGLDHRESMKSIAAHHRPLSPLLSRLSSLLLSMQRADQCHKPPSMCTSIQGHKEPLCSFWHIAVILCTVAFLQGRSYCFRDDAVIQFANFCLGDLDLIQVEVWWKIELIGNAEPGCFSYRLSFTITLPSCHL